ncbi:MAG: hypothetical protein BGO34_16995 [Bacteroidia bacterium 44-10]|nr:MAG: hypothetical protein BGO34_16995 [Bacteroidia bacterium 44-10]
MTKEQIKKWAEEHTSLRIVEIKTQEHTRRGLFQGIQPEGCFLFLWIPGLAPEVKSIEDLHLEAVGIVTKYEANEIVSIKQI